jgi:hypothetical protein
LLAPPSASDEAIKELAAAQRSRNRLLAAIAVLLIIGIGLLIARPG